MRVLIECTRKTGIYSRFGACEHVVRNELYRANRDRKKANKQDITYCSVDSNGQDNIQLPLQ